MPKFETIAQFAECWRRTPERLRERAELWPEPLTWAWFLGERCAQYTLRERLEILSVAIAYAHHHRVPNALDDGKPVRWGKFWSMAKQSPAGELALQMAWLGGHLDAHDAGQLADVAARGEADESE